MKELKIPDDLDIATRYANSMLLFERDGLIHYGKWCKWNAASGKEATKILEDFKNERVQPSL